MCNEYHMECCTHNCRRGDVKITTNLRSHCSWNCAEKGDICALACLPKMVLFTISGLDDDMDETVGVNGGSLFTDGPTPDGPITAIRVWVDKENHVSGIQVQYGNVWGNAHGRNEGEKHEATLSEGEKLREVLGSTSDKGIASLKFISTQKNYGPYGNVIIASQFTSEDLGCHIIYISGRADNDRIESLEFHYKCPI